MTYGYIDVVQDGKSVLAWLRDDKGRLKVEEHNVQKFLYTWEPDTSDNPENKMFDMYGCPMRKRRFSNSYELKDFASIRNNLCESDVPVKYKVLQDAYPDADSTAPVNLMYWDIETEVDLSLGEGYALPDDPWQPINMIQTYDVKLRLYRILTTMSPDSITERFKTYKDGIPIHIEYFTSEADMLDFFADVSLKDIDVFGGWNTDDFDVPYLLGRSAMLFGDDKAATMYCRNGQYVQCKQKYDKFSQEEKTLYTFVGRHQVDMLVAAKKFFPGSRRSWSLDSFAEDKLGETKVDYEHDLGTLCREHPNTFMEYGIRDVYLLRGIDEKMNIMMIANILAREHMIFLNDVTGTVKLIEMGLMKFLRAQNVVMPDKVRNEKEAFEGAIVYQSVSGRHANIFSIDLTGLYPSVIIMLGMSPETFIMQLRGGRSDWLHVMMNSDKELIVDLVQIDQTVKLKASEINKIIKENGYTISAYGSIFSGEAGYLSQFVKQGFDERARYKSLMKKETNKELAGRYDILQQVMKIRNNSIYGATGEASFRLYDIRMAQSTTVTGQEISKWQAVATNMGINKRVGLSDIVHSTDFDLVEKVQDFDNKFEGSTNQVSCFIPSGESYTRAIYDINHMLAGDTDSCMMSAMAKFAEGCDMDEMTVWCDDIAKEVNASFKSFIDFSFNTPESRLDTVQADREMIADKGIFLTKKRYICHLVNDEGKKVDKLKVMGVQTKKSDTPLFVKDILEDVTTLILDGHSTNDIYAHLNKKKETFMDEPISRICKPVSLNNLKHYERSYAETGSYKGVYYTAKAGMAWNEKRDIQDVRLTSGMKIGVLDIMHDPVFTKIGVPVDDADRLPEWFNEHITLDYQSMWGGCENTVYKWLTSIEWDLNTIREKESKQAMEDVGIVW